MAAEHGAVLGHDVARRRDARPREDPAQVAAAEEADVLALGRAGDREAGGLGLGPHLQLVGPAQREAQPADQRRGTVASM